MYFVRYIVLIKNTLALSFVSQSQNIIYIIIYGEGRRGGGDQACEVKRDSCGFDSHLGERNIQYPHVLTLVTRQSAALTSASQHTMP